MHIFTILFNNNKKSSTRNFRIIENLNYGKKGSKTSLKGYYYKEFFKQLIYFPDDRCLIINECKHATICAIDLCVSKESSWDIGAELPELDYISPLHFS